MFAFREPSDNDLGRFLHGQREQPLSYAEAGAALAEAAPAGYSVDHGRILLGEGEGDFRRAAEALAGWRMFETGWTRIFPEGAAVAEGGPGEARCDRGAGRAGEGGAAADGGADHAGPQSMRSFSRSAIIRSYSARRRMKSR